MEKINQHIERLLAYHDYVVVPGLGGFVVQFQSAEIKGDTIVAPRVAIGFNPLMLHSDGLLAIEVARAEQVSYRKAMEIISEEIDALKLMILDDKSLKFGNLGFLTSTDNKSITFEPLELPAFLPLNLGLHDLKISQLKKEIKGQHKHISIGLPTAKNFKYAAAAVLLFGMLTISNRVSDTRKYDSAELLSFPEMLTQNKTDVVEQTENVEIAVNPVENAEVLPAVPSYPFHVVVASLRTQDAADSYCKALLETDFSEAHIINSSTLHMVALQSFENKKDAINFMKNIRKTDDRFETAWVMCE